MKTIVGHISVDLDVTTASWLIKKYLPGWSEADMVYVPAGSTYQNVVIDSDPDVIHVDTGMGKFDHHQTNDFTCATKLVFEDLLSKKLVNPKDVKALMRLVTYVNETDHFQEVFYPEPNNDRYDFCLHQISHSLHAVYKDDQKIVNILYSLLDAALLLLKNKVYAEQEISNGFILASKMGKCLILESKNEETVKLALKSGYALVARRDPDRGFIRIKTLPEKKYDLTRLYEEIIKFDPKATWFLHVSKHMLLNGSSKNPNFIPSSLSLKKLIEIITQL